MRGSKMDIFPVVVAVGDAFCDRVNERELLKQYVKHGRHTVIIAPRRYGKTSLVNQTVLELKLPFTMLELTMATTIQEVEAIISKHISNLIYSILPRTNKAKHKILNLFRWLHPEFILNLAGQQLIFHPERSNTSPIENIAELLKKLDLSAQTVNKRVIVVMDEFQQLSEIQNHTVEAAIRNAMQYSKNVSYIFLGSNRHMLLNMFNNRNRPFYNSCETIKLDRISHEDNLEFIQNAAVKKWGKKLPYSLVNEILQLTECHPSYVNRICGYFWLVNEKPTSEKVSRYWLDFIASRHAEFTQNILNLSKNQRKVLAYIANTPSEKIGGHKLSLAIGIPEASVRQAQKKLLDIDYLYEDKQGLVRVLDPAFRDFIKLLAPH